MTKSYIIKNKFGVLYYKDKGCTILHREDGPAIEYADGSKFWYLNGIHHRSDEPAREYNDGTKEWYLNGNLHRIDGPAYEGISEDGYKEWSWWLNGKEYSEEEHKRLVKMINFL